jgi:hypothetical protein
MQLKRIKRDYRHQRSPGRFLSFNKKVKLCLTDNPNYPDSIWGANATLLLKYFGEVDSLEVSCHMAGNGDRLLIRQRDRLMEEIILTLDEIASFLEAASTRNPDALLSTGFSISQERRSPSRTRLPLMASSDFAVVNTVDQGKAVGSASSIPGAFNLEIQLNKRDPSMEADWSHKEMYPDPSNMLMENLDPGNTFFRARPHGPNGAGPWSGIVSTLIT